MNRRHHAPNEILIWSAIIGALGLVIRLLFIWQAESHLIFTIPVMDMEYHHQWASAIAAGKEFITGPFFRAPLYPYFLGTVYYLFGSGYWPILIIQSLLGAASAVLVFLIGERTFSRRTGIIAGLAVAFYGPLIFYTGLKLIPTLAIFLTLLGLYWLVKWLDGASDRSLWLAGISFGLSAIARPTVLLFVVIFIVWQLLRTDRRSMLPRLKRIIPLVLGVILPILPVTAYNLAQTGEFIPIGTYTGINFYIGNNAESDGISARLPGARKDWWGMMQDAERIAETESRRTLTEAEQSSFWLSKGIGEIAAHPGFFVKNLSKKTVLFCQGIELSNNFDFYFFARKVPLLKYLIWQKGLFFPYGLILPLAVIGLILGAGRNRKSAMLAMFLLTYLPAVVLFFVTTRYRLPAVPVLLLFAAFGVTTALESFRRWSRKKALTLTGLFLLLLVGCNLDHYGTAPKNSAQGYFTLATLEAQRGRMAQAEQNYFNALNQDTTFTETYNDLGLFLAQKGDLEGATRLLEKGMALDPNNFTLAYNLGYVYLISGRAGEAVAPLRRVLAVTPRDIHALNNLGLAFLHTEQYDSALVSFARATAIDPDFSDGWSNAASAWMRLGMSDSARVCLMRAQRLPEESTDAYYHLGRMWLQVGQADSASMNLKKYLISQPSDATRAAEAKRLFDSLFGK